MSWSNGQVKRHVGKRKLLEGKMCGRAKLYLLRRRQPFLMLEVALAANRGSLPAVHELRDRFCTSAIPQMGTMLCFLCLPTNNAPV